MSKVLTRNIALFGGMILAGFVCVQAAPFLRGVHGSPGPTVLSAERPVVAAIAILVCLAVTAAIACVVGRVVNAAVGLFVLGAGVFTLDSRFGGLRELVFAHPEKSAIYGMALETIVLA